ncbi:MAG: type II toxin-antitoxin system VapC family toxin, partial [Candidatus Dormibacteraceae bacterium]
VRHPLMPLLDRVWELRENLTAYDAAYVALAERLGVSLLTADTGIARAPKIRCKVNLVKLEALS